MLGHYALLHFVDDRSNLLHSRFDVRLLPLPAVVVVLASWFNTFTTAAALVYVPIVTSIAACLVLATPN